MSPFLGSLSKRPQECGQRPNNRAAPPLAVVHCQTAGMESRKVALYCLLQALEQLDDDTDALSASLLTADTDALAAIDNSSEKRCGMAGRVWAIQRNDQSWLFEYALRSPFCVSSTWRALFRIPHQLYLRVTHELRPFITAQNTCMRNALRAEIKVAAFLMYCGGASFEAVATQLGVGPSTVPICVSQVSRQICSSFRNKINFPTKEEDITCAMDSFKKIRGLPYCVGAIDGTHIKWPACPQEQFYEYRCYKGYASVALFAVATADRRFIYTDVGRPGVLGDSTIFTMSSLKRNISIGTWLGPEIPDLRIGDVNVRPYLIGDCAFTLDVFMMKSASQGEIAANPALNTWDSVASQTHKPIECAFGILKGRFMTLKTGILLQHEDDISYLIMSCVLLHNMCIDTDVDLDFFLTADEDAETEVITAETAAGKKQRDALLYYVTDNIQETE